MNIRSLAYCALFLGVQMTYCYALQTVPKVVVTPKKSIRYTLSNAPKTVITQSDIINTGATSLSEALQSYGGVQLDDITGNASQVMLSMRGFGVNANSNTLLLINGIPLSNPDLAPPDLNAIPLQEIEQIEVVNGSESVLYGDQAVGGIINIITKQNKKNNLDLSCTAGSYNTHNCSGLFNHTSNNLSYNMNVISNHSDNYREHNTNDQTVFISGLEHHTSQNDIRLDLKLINERMLYPGALSAQQVRQNRRQASNTTDFFKDWNGLFNIHFLHALSDNWQLITDFSRREMHGSGVLTTPFSQSRYVNFLKPQIKGVWHKLNIVGGTDIENDQYYLNSSFGTNSDSLQKYSAYGIVNYPLNNQTTLSIGARGAQQDSHLISTPMMISRAFASTIGLSWELSHQLKYYVRQAGNFRFPNADENASAGSQGLKTQRGVSYETGIQWDWRNLQSQFSVYQLNLRDEITFDPLQTPEHPFGSNSNLDPTSRSGLSITEKYALTNQVSIDGQYNYVNARFRSGLYSGNRIPLVAENILHAGCNVSFHTHWNFYTEAIYTGNQYAANDNMNIAGLLGGYTVYNAHLRYEFNHFSASLRVNNIFNKNYYFYTVFTPATLSESFYPAPDRNIMLTLKYDFI